MVHTLKDRLIEDADALYGKGGWTLTALVPAASLDQATRRAEEAEALVGKFLLAHRDGPGLIDCIDNQGERYTSKFLGDLLSTASSITEKKA